MLSAGKRGLYRSNHITYLSPEEITPNPSQPRQQFDAKSLMELADSISRYGILQPLTVHRGIVGYELISGERRLRAAKLAGLEKVPCILLNVDKSQSAVLALVENLHRSDLDFIEEAEGISRLVRLYGLSQEEVARKLGKSQSAVANKLRILKLPAGMLYSIREAGLTERHARALLRLPDDEERATALEKIIEEGMNVARCDDYIDHLLDGDDLPPPIPRSPRPLFIVKDVRLFLNTVSRAMVMMKQSGIDAKCGRDETDEDIILTIRIPKTADTARR